MMRSSFILLTVVMLFPTLLLAEKRSMVIRWSDVAGANGYIVQWQLKDGTAVDQQKTGKSEIELHLEAGAYTIRVSAMNRFGKPAGWSEWKSFRVQDAARVQSIDLSRPDTEPEEEPEKQYAAIPLWKRTIPGWVQIERKQWRGWAYPTTLGLLTIYAWDQKRRGDLIAADSLNDPDTIMPLSVTSYAPLASLLWVRRSQQRQIYDQHQRNQRVAGYAALGVIGLHWIDISFFDDERSAFIFSDGALAFRMRF